MSDPNQHADDAFDFSNDIDDDNVSSAEEQQPVEQQPEEKPVEAAPVAEQEEQPAEPEQDAEPSEPEPEAEPVEAEKGKSHLVPVSELQKERQKRQDEARLRELAESNAKTYEAMIEKLTQQQANQQQPAPQPEPAVELPDPYEDPEGYTQAVVNQRVGQMQQQMVNMQLNMSERLAVSEHGREAVDAAFDAVSKANIAGRFVQDPDAYGSMVKWHKEQVAIAEIGDDPSAYKAKLEAEMRQQILAELKQGGVNPDLAQPTGQHAQTVQPPQRLPGSLADAPAEGVQGRQMSQQALADDIYASDRDRQQF